MTEITKEELKLLTALQPRIREAMGPVQIGDWFRNPDSGEVEIAGIDTIFTGTSIRVPLLGPMPGVPAERTLLGILLSLPGVHDYRIYPGNTSAFLDIYDEQNELVSSYHADTPYLALLKAYAHQEGVKVEG